jgi:hypothetical protein
MSAVISQKVADLIRDPNTLKVLGTIGRDGSPHVVFKGSTSLDAEGRIRYFELNETSQTNKNLVYSLWFKRQVSINILSPDKISYQIKGIPVRAIIAGDEFEQVYRTLQEKRGKDTDLSTIYIIEPEEVKEETFAVRQGEEREKYPLLGHLDRFRRE